MTEAARRLGCSTAVIYHWIHTGQLTARRGQGGRLCIPWDDRIQAGCHELIAGSSHLDRTARPRVLPAPPSPAADGEVSVTEAAYQLGCSIHVIYYWIGTGKLTARRGDGGRFCIPWNDRASAHCQELITRSARLGRTARPRTLPAPPSPAADGEVSVTEAAYQLGCSIHVIYYWIDTGKLAVRRGQGSRLHIPWNDQVQAECRARIEQSGHLNPVARRTKPRQRH